MNSQLFRQKAYIAGEWVESETGEVQSIFNPATGDLLGTVPNLGSEDTQKAIDFAYQAQKAWAAKTAQERSSILRRWYELMIAHADNLANILTLEQGKPLAEAKGEILYAASFIEWFAEEGKRIYGDIIPSHKAGARLMVLKQPIGVVGAITPWNFPSAMITRKCAPAMAAGCPFIVKPAPDTPFSALALAVLAEEAGVPAGIFNVVTGDAVAIGGELTANDKVKKLSFTGSTNIGKLLMGQCANTVKKVSLELGGNAPFIIFDDADIDSAIEGAMASKFRNAGQTCVCTNRFLVQEGVHDLFVEKLTQAVESLQVGNGLEAGISQGPLINDAAISKIEDHVADAIAKGACLNTGGNRHALGGTFYEPTVISGVTLEMKVAKEETFGPLAPIFSFKTEEDALQMANDSEFGLAAYIYTRDLGRSWRMGEGLEYGMVGINEGIISTTVAPFGGIKQSGIGREGSKYGIEDYVEIKYLMVGGI
ncbi:succinate-semialdehyde dehydrogenase [Marinomonas sp. S3726]|uniref:NAD-dependent succinate-semialdehyde dehydrogenase n=1 Tax=Marinomonas sp. S3726 TaxID=579484 RepID=UPI0005FA6250|nr:NAD-dependent succinate-semialdehyde dehydrogenase [Marinomonas sp. S3726]KJZ12518.1 succinate-semialdehyde dehydrogenase [Marinomonas sp. S3726]